MPMGQPLSMNNTFSHTTTEGIYSVIAKKMSFIVPVLGGCIIALFVAETEAAPSFFKEGLTRIDNHQHGATAFYHEGSSENRDDVLAVQVDVPRFLQKGLARIDKHTYGATAFYR